MQHHWHCFRRYSLLKGVRNFGCDQGSELSSKYKHLHLKMTPGCPGSSSPFLKAYTFLKIQ
jgi:hypothetical protein